MTDRSEPPHTPEIDPEVEKKGERSAPEAQQRAQKHRLLNRQERELSRIQNEVRENASISHEDTPEVQFRSAQRDRLTAHRNGGSVLEELDTYLSEKRTAEIARHEYPNTPVEKLPNRNLQGVVYEGITQLHFESQRSNEIVEVHPVGHHLRDGRLIEPDITVQNEQGLTVEVVDAKAYSRKSTQNPEAAASSLTHMQNLEKSARYVNIDAPGLQQVTFALPIETAGLPAVQEAVASLGNDKVRVVVETVGTEAEIRQQMEDLRTLPGERFIPSAKTFQQIQHIQSLPVTERQAAVAQLVDSLKDAKGEPSAELRNLSWCTRIERDGKGITFINGREGGKEYTIMYK